MPKFYCVGTQKAGTTSLHRILSQHPDIGFPIIKETGFFHAESEYKKGLGYYEDLFRVANNASVFGEIDPNYMYLPAVPQRIYDASGPRTKFIFMLRHPVDRMVSHYLMCKQKGYETLELHQALSSEKVRLSGSESNNIRFSYVARSLYAEQVKRFLLLFPMENIIFIIFESQFIDNRDKTIKELLKFLEVPSIDLSLNVHANVTKRPVIPALGSLIYGQSRTKRMLKSMLPFPAVRSRLKAISEVPVRKENTISLEQRALFMQQYFIKDIQELESLTGLDLRIWYDKL